MKTYEQTIKYLAVNMASQFFNGCDNVHRGVGPVPYIYGVLEDQVLLDVDAEYEAMLGDFSRFFTALESIRGETK